MMTEKQFKLFVGKYYGVQKVDGEVIFDSIISMAEADVLVDLLNDLTEENEQLKQDKTNLHRAMSRDKVKYNQFKDKVFCCIDAKIKLLKDCYMSNEAKILEDLKEEISDDRND